MKPKSKPNNIDIYAGKKIKEGRLLRNLSQSMLANEIGISYQQLSKYEAGTNRVAIGTLYYISKALKFELEFFVP